MMKICPKLVLVAATLVWASVMVYLLSHVERFAQVGGKLKNGAHWAEELVSNMSKNFKKDQEPITISASQHLLNEQSAAASNLINIVMQAQEDDLGGLISAVNSVVKHTKNKVHFYFAVVNEPVQHHLEEWMKMPELAEIKHSIASLPVELRNYSNAVKFAFITMFPSLEGKAIYLDPDVIIQGDVGEMMHHNPVTTGNLGAFSDDCHAGSVSKTVSSRTESRFAGRLNLKHPSFAVFLHDVNPLACTFNTGVFITSDLAIWRQEMVARKIISLLQASAKETIIGPQGGTDVVEAAMLAVFYHRTSPLDPLWHVRHLGVTIGSRYSPSFLTSAKLLHWSGHFKPWKAGRGSVSAYEQQLWAKYFVPDPLAKFQPVRKSKGEI